MTDFPFAPRVVGWELTLACNMQCLHCGSRAGEARPDELTEAEGLSLIDQLLELGCEVVTLSGGEPLLHPSWHVYAARFAAAGVQTYMITNGLLLARNASRMVDAGLKRIGISFDGTETTHDLVRARKGSFRSAIDGARSAMEAGISVGAVTHVSMANIQDLEAMYEVFASEGLSFWQIQVVFNQGRMQDHDEYAMVPERLAEVANFVAARQALGGRPRVVPGDNLGYFCEPPIREHPWKGCFAGRHVMGIDADGSIKGCLSLPRDFVEGNIRKESLRAIWEDPERFRYNRYFDLADLKGDCAGCPEGLRCRASCTVTAFAATGDRFDNPFCITRVKRQKQEV